MATRKSTSTRRLKAIPDEVDLILYSHLKWREKRAPLREFLNDFSRFFGLYSYVVGTESNWRSTLDRIFLGSGWESSRRDILVATFNGLPVGGQDFFCPEDEVNAYDEGIYIREDYRRQGIGTILHDVLFTHLRDHEKTKTFYVGKEGDGYSARVRKNRISQAFAEKQIEKCAGSIVDLIRTEKRRWVSSYGIQLHNYPITYGVSNRDLTSS